MNDIINQNVLGAHVDHETNKEAVAIRKLTLSVKRDMHEIGCRLNRVNELLPHGQFSKWLNSKTDFSHRTANNLMNAARLVTEHALLHGIEQTALYRLAASRLNPEVRDRVIARIKGERVTSTKSITALINEEKECLMHSGQEPKGGPAPREQVAHDNSAVDGAVLAFAAILLEGGLSEDDLDRLQSIAHQKNGNLQGLDRALQMRRGGVS